jgi:hypothetical protein
MTKLSLTRALCLLAFASFTYSAFMMVNPTPAKAIEPYCDCTKSGECGPGAGCAVDCKGWGQYSGICAIP